MTKRLPALEMLTQQMPFWTSRKAGNTNPEGANQYIPYVAIYISKPARAKLQARQVPTVGSNLVVQHFNMRYNSSKSRLVAR
jgi:hypothetical protein